ncbi:MAG: hypothetical protein ACRDND_17410, partial [Streptosporangiaceae bacterium]
MNPSGQAGRPHTARTGSMSNSWPTTAAVAQGQGQLLHGERDPLGPAGHRRGQGRPGLRPSRWVSIRATSSSSSGPT